MKFNFMKSKIFEVLSILLFVEILFCITGCKDLLISQNAAKTSININLDLSKLIKTSRNQTSQEVTDYLLKIEAYNAENYQENAEVENLPLLTQAKSKVDVSGLVKVTLEVPIDSNVILVAKLHKIIDENTESEKPLYKGKSEIFKVKESDNKIHLVLTKTNSDLDIDISLNTQSTYKVEHYKQNIEDDNYTLVESDSENKTGTIGTNTEAVAKSYEGFSVNPFDQQKIFSDGSTTVKIYYTRNVYTVTFNANGGSLKDDTSQKVKYGETPAEPTPPEKEGYNFGYWYTSKDNGVTEDVSYNFSTTVTNDVTLYAMWIAGSDIVYKVEHYKQNIEDDNYTLVESDSENKTGTIGTNTEAVAKSYEGFSVNPFEQKPILADGSTTVKIYYTRNVYTVIFNANGGTLKDDTSQKVKYEGTPTEPTPPEKEGYNFGYWYTSKDNGVTEDVSYNFSTTVTNDVTLYAMWIAGSDIVYKVEHYKQNIEDDNYTLVESDSENKTGTIGTNTEAVAKSYEGFSVNPFEQKPILADGSTTVKIYYTRNVYTVIFNANGGSYVETQIVKYEENATLPATPTKDGYVFVGWYTSFDNGFTLDTEFDFTTPPESNITLFAKWKLAERFVFVQGASINGAITTEGHIESEIFKEGGIVSIPNFYISDHEVTQAEYKAIMGTWPDESVVDVEQIGVGDNYPVYYVNWFDTLVYCNKRSIKENLTPCYTINESTNPDEWGDVPDSENHENFETWFDASCNFQADGYRLPTDAEWEYAARGGNGLTGFQYKYAGSNSIDMVAWCSENSSGTSHEVKLKQPNDLGLYDMSGNLWEWCWDDSASDNLINYRKNRGGNWYDGTDGCMLSYRNNYYSYDRMSNIGFRLVRTATEQSQGDVYSQGISLNGKIYDKTSEVVVVPKGTVAQITMEDDSSWNTYLEDDADLWYKGVFLKGRKVQLSPFTMSQFEVTQELYELVLGENPSTYINNQTTDELVNLRPVDTVKWYDAVNFCNELTKRIMGEDHCVYTVSDVVMDETNSYITNANVAIDLSKKGYRLPTEAEWEFAARGGNPASDVWKYAYAGVSANSNEIDNYFWNNTDTTHEVGRKNSNSLGLYDMSSNMYEWTCDGYKQNITITDEFIVNPVEKPDEDDKRFIARGGYFASESFTRYVSYRHGTKSDSALCGFRLVRTITE